MLDATDAYPFDDPVEGAGAGDEQLAQEALRKMGRHRALSRRTGCDGRDGAGE